MFINSPEPNLSISILNSWSDIDRTAVDEYTTKCTVCSFAKCNGECNIDATVAGANDAAATTTTTTAEAAIASLSDEFKYKSGNRLNSCKFYHQQNYFLHEKFVHLSKSIMHHLLYSCPKSHRSVLKRKAFHSVMSQIKYRIQRTKYVIVAAV